MRAGSLQRLTLDYSRDCQRERRSAVQYDLGQSRRACDRGVGVYRIKDSRALGIDVGHARRHIDLALRQRLSFLNERLDRQRRSLRRCVRAENLDAAIDRAIPARANRLSCRIDCVQSRDHVRARLAPLDSSNGELRRQPLGRPNRAMQHRVMRRVHAAHRLVARERGGLLEQRAHRNQHRPFETYGKHRMRDHAANGVHVTWHRIAERSGIRHRPARIDLADQGRTRTPDDGGFNRHDSYY